MENTDKMTLTLTRIEMIDLRLATLHIVHDAQDEFNDPATSESRKGVLDGTIRKWASLREEIIRQFKEQDELA